MPTIVNQEPIAKLEVKNFLNLQDVLIEKKRITILIGPQASGKSLISKLFFFFQDFVSSTFIRSFYERNTKRHIIKYSKERFQKIFPNNTWGTTEFSITYTIGDYAVHATNKKTSNNRFHFTIDYNAELSNLHRRIAVGVNRILDSKDPTDASAFWRAEDEARNYVRLRLLSEGVLNCFGDGTFIPAGRSFFSSLKSNVFRFIANEISIDPLLAEFGSEYETALRLKNSDWFENSGQYQNSSRKKVSALSRKLICGDFERDADGSWIKHENFRVKLENASSGQQEATPMLLIFERTAAFSTNRKTVPDRQTIYVEEPEAHLFPSAQSDIAELFGVLYESGTNIFLTTHSPYLLSSFNVMLLRQTSKKGSSNKPRIAPDDIASYAVTNGKVRTIFEEDHGLIGSSVIDEISDTLDRQISQLLYE